MLQVARCFSLRIAKGEEIRQYDGPPRAQLASFLSYR